MIEISRGLGESKKFFVLQLRQLSSFVVTLRSFNNYKEPGSNLMNVSNLVINIKRWKQKILFYVLILNVRLLKLPIHIYQITHHSHDFNANSGKV